MRGAGIFDLVVALLLAASVTSPARDAIAQADAVDVLIREEMRRQNIPGLSLAILQDGEIVKIEGYGVADLAGGTLATADTVYRIASVSKQFIATGILLLAQEGRLALDDAVARFIGEAPDAWGGITLRHLLTHTSGLVREGPRLRPVPASKRHRRHPVGLHRAAPFRAGGEGAVLQPRLFRSGRGDHAGERPPLGCVPGGGGVSGRSA